MKFFRKINIVFIIAFIIVLSACNNNDDNIEDKYDYIFGDKTKELVTVTFKSLNYSVAKDKVWGVEKGKQLGYNYEPKYPASYITIAEYGLTQDFTPSNNKKINLTSYYFYNDTTVYVKYYGGLETRRFCIPNGPTNKGSGMMFEQKSIFYNTEIYTMPTLENQFFEIDWGNIVLRESLDPWLSQWGFTKIVGWYYDEELTKEVTLPFVLNNSNGILFWMKCE